MISRRIGLRCIVALASPASAADLLIHGGPILTMVGDRPHTVAAVVVEGGRIGFAGPLAGFQTAVQHCAGAAATSTAAPEGYRYLLTVACDTPRFPLDLLARLAQALEHEGADIAVAGAPEQGPGGAWSLRTQPVFCLLRTSLAGSLNAFLTAGGRKVDAWTAQHRSITVAFDRPQDDALAFFNANTLDELGRLEASPAP